MPKLYFGPGVMARAAQEYAHGKIVESVILEDERSAVSRLSDPFCFQALGYVLGIDWYSSALRLLSWRIKGCDQPALQRTRQHFVVCSQLQNR